MRGVLPQLAAPCAGAQDPQQAGRRYSLGTNACLPSWRVVRATRGLSSVAACHLLTMCGFVLQKLRLTTSISIRLHAVSLQS